MTHMGSATAHVKQCSQTETLPPRMIIITKQSPPIISIIWNHSNSLEYDLYVSYVETQIMAIPR